MNYKLLFQYYPVLTKDYSRITLYYKVFFYYYPVLQILLCTTPIRPYITKYYTNTTIYYSSILYCTTKYYASTTTYYCVVQSTTPIGLCITKKHRYYSILQCIIAILPCIKKYYSNTYYITKYHSNTTLYYKIFFYLKKYLFNTIPYFKYYFKKLHNYPVLQNTNQTLFVLLQYYLVLPKYFSSIILYYKY